MRTFGDICELQLVSTYVSSMAGQWRERTSPGGVLSTNEESAAVLDIMDCVESSEKAQFGMVKLYQQL